MKCIISFIKRECVLVIATICAVVSCVFSPPSRAYLGYIDFDVLALLAMLMLVVAGLRGLRVFDIIANRLIAMTKGSLFKLFVTMWALCFVSAMFITNDVALITFVPLSIGIFKMCKMEKYIIYNVVLQSVAANLGSMLTPMGNPQNLYIYRYYDVSILEFLKITFPIIIISAVLLILASLPMANKKIDENAVVKSTEAVANKKLLGIYCALGAVSLLAVCKVLNPITALFIVAVACFIFDRAVIKKVDYILLVTFVMFFVFVGNVGSIESVKTIMQSIIEGRTLEIGVVLSQFISNVPATVMLSAFTEDYVGLIKGVNIGGLGTLIASMASLIAFRIYSQFNNSNKLKYSLIFSGVNIIFLLLLYGSCIII